MKDIFKTASALILALLLLYTPAFAAEGTAYTDVSPDAWYAGAVAYCRDKNLMQGTGDGRFSPNTPMTRAMLATLLHRMSGSKAAYGDGGFADVQPGSWYYDDVRWAAAEGYMTGYSAQRFGPNDVITREQVAAVLWRFAGSPSGREMEPFADQGDISDYAIPAVAWARTVGVLSGMGNNRFVPKEGATRAQVATILMNYGSGFTEVSAMDIMCQPCGVAVMEDGALLVTDSYNKVIWQVKNGKSTMYAGGDTVEDLFGQPIGGYNDAALKESYFKKPWAIAPFLDGWAVSDRDNDVVRLLRPEATETVNGSTSERLHVTDLGVAFDAPSGLASDPNGNLYVSDFGENAVRKITPEGEVTTFCSDLSEPMGLCWWDGYLYVAESGANRIVKVKDKKVTVMAGCGEEGFEDGPAEKASFASPQALAVGEDGTIYVSDTDNSAIRQIKDGQVSTLIQRDLSDLSSFFPIAPAGLAVRGNMLYVCDSFARKLLALPLWGGAA